MRQRELWRVLRSRSTRVSSLATAPRLLGAATLALTMALPPAAAPVLADSPVAGPLAEGLYAGHQVASGSIRVPFAGTRSTRTETFALARITASPEEIVVSGANCAVLIGQVAGASAKMSQETARALPRFVSRLTPSGGGRWTADWVVSWDEEDVDGDGNPGATITIKAPLCGGSVYIGSTTRSVATGVVEEARLEGEVEMRVRQRVLGVSRRCLSWVTSDSVDRMRGSFRYVRVPDGTTCDDLTTDEWPGRLVQPGE